MTRAEVRGILGDPRRTNSLRELAYDGFCNNPYWYEYVDIIYENEKVIDISLYERGGNGDYVYFSCTNYFRPVSLGAVQEQQNNMRNCISLIEKSIVKAIRRLLPFKNILA